jgi:long-subunit fatty acid transport protein
MDLEIMNYGASAAFTASETFSVGIGVSYYDASFDAVTDRYDFVSDPFGPPNYSAGNLFASQAASGSDSDWGFNLGFLWQASPKFWLGGVYRYSPSFDFDYVGTCGPSDPTYCEGSGNEFATTGSINVPTMYGLGMAIKPTDALTVTLDWDFVQYSDLEEGFTGVPVFVDFYGFEDFSVDDANEYHLGLEYGFVKMTSPLFLRAGAWLDPAHAVTYSGTDPLLQTLWSAANAADDQWHYTAGLGMAFANGKAQLDLAADLADRVETYSLSGVYRF